MTFQEVWEVLSYPFVTRALIVGVMVSLCASILGVILVLKRYSLIGHGLFEVGFAALSVALAFNLPPLYVSTPLVIAASFVIMFVSQRRRVGGDVAIGIAASADEAKKSQFLSIEDLKNRTGANKNAIDGREIGRASCRERV